MSADKELPQLLALLKRSQSFAENLLTENEQLRLKLVALESRIEAAENERDGLRSRIDEVQSESQLNSERFQEIDEELNAMANLHVATWQLHASLRLRDVVATILEICVNLVGADEAVVYMRDEQRNVLMPVSDRVSEPAKDLPLDAGPAAQAVEAGETKTFDEGDPRVVVPLAMNNRVIGAVVVHTFLPQKETLNDLDHQLFDLIAGQGSTAVLGAFLSGASSTNLNADTIREQME